MPRTAKKTKTVPVDAVAETEIRSVGDIAAEIVASAAEPDAVKDAAQPETAANGEMVFIPLDKLKRHPKNARKTPHSEASIESKAASIAAKGMLQNLVVEPERNADGELTGCYLVSVGEGRRLAQLLRVKRKEIKKTEPIRCVIDTANDPAEISLDENVNRENLHPADEFEKFRELAELRGWGPEEIAARFGVTAKVVRQRLRLANVSARLIQFYRDGELTMDQLQAFAITDDHDRQEKVFGSLSHNRDPSLIRRELTAGQVPASDRRAVFVGAEAYLEAGGNIVQDLFSEGRGGFFEDPDLLDRLAIEKLKVAAEEIREAEGWKWAEASISFQYVYDMRRVYPGPVELSEEDDAALTAAREEYENLAEDHEGDEELPPDVVERFAELEAEIEGLEAKQSAYDPIEVARAGIFVSIGQNGGLRIERGFVRAEDEEPEPEDENEAESSVHVNEDGEIIENGQPEEGGGTGTDPDEDEEAEDEQTPLPEALVRDLTAHRTLGLRLTLGESPSVALLALTHALAVQTFFPGAKASPLEIRATSTRLADHAASIGDTAMDKALADRHADWASDMPKDVAELWDFVITLDQASIMALLAHCVSLTVDAVKLPWDRKQFAHKTADALATETLLDMTIYWTPTVDSYLGRTTKANILAAVREAVGEEAADGIAKEKKPDMAEKAEGLLRGTGWLPPLLRTEPPAWLEDIPLDPPFEDEPDPKGEPLPEHEPAPEGVPDPDDEPAPEEAPVWEVEPSPEDAVGPDSPDEAEPDPEAQDGEDFTIAAQ